MKNMLIALMLSLASFSAFAEHEGPVKPSQTINLNKDNVLLLDNEVNVETVAKLMQRAQELDAKLTSNDPLYLVLNTPGGSIQDGLELITFLKGLNRPVHTITIFAASMGFQIVQGLGDRLVTPFGTLMAHKARGAFRGEFPGQIDSRYVYYIKRLNEMDKITAARTNGKLTVKSLQDLYENEHWVEGRDAVESGLADKVVIGKCDHSLNGKRTSSFEYWGFLITLVQSECPMNQGIIDLTVQVATDQGLMTIKEFLSKGGSLEGKSTSDYGYSPYYGGGSSYGPSPASVTSAPAAKAPVLTVDGLTMEKINKEVEKIRDNFKKRLAVVKE